MKDFIAIAAHELLHPLVPIRNAAALLRNESLDAAAIRRAAEVIEQQASTMSRLIADIVDASRLQVDAMEIHPARTQLSELVDRAVEWASPIARERGHTVSVNVPPEPVYLNVDVSRLAQALHHIITNTIKYTDKYGYIRVRAHRVGSVAVIVVTDTGIGLPAADLEKIFDVFQPDQSGRIEAGLGLYLAREIVGAHGGTVTAGSDGKGRGSVFTMKLPCEPATDAEAGPDDSATAGDPSPA